MYSVIAQPARDFVHWGCKNDPLFSQASHKVFPLKLISWNCGNTRRHFVTRNHWAKDGFTSLKCKSCLRVGAPCVLGPKRKLPKLSAFQNNTQKDESGSRHTGSNSLKNSVGLSYAPQESEASSVAIQKPQGAPNTYPAEAVSAAGSAAIHNLFKSWLMLLRMPSMVHAVNEMLQQPSAMETSETQNLIHQKERVPILKAVWCYLLRLDATIKLPLLIFIPLYLAVNLRSGAQVSRELTPLWVLGPLIAALYVKLLRGICALYVFTFKQTVKVLMNLPTYYLVAYNYIAHGSLMKV